MTSISHNLFQLKKILPKCTINNSRNTFHLEDTSLFNEIPIILYCELIIFYGTPIFKDFMSNQAMTLIIHGSFITIYTYMYLCRLGCRT